ncbi:MAG: hypothetical protein IAE91_04760 [Ignavibacteriaceae bacterium]|nr:hypothetical protein [Ignavibacteriaceae bacterium]
MKQIYKINAFKVSLLMMAVFFSFEANAQFINKWMSVGSLHSWYSEIGCELEEAGFIRTQQFGLAYPAIYRYQDMQAAKGMWIGAKNFTDERGDFYPVKVINFGPRAPQFWAAYPQKFDMVSQFEAPLVSVDGNLSYEKDVEINSVDPTMKWDRMLDNVVNTQLGITMTRRILQFSQQFHDNYIVYEYIYKNTGNTNADPTIELPNTTLTDVWFFFTYRYSVNKQARYVIENATGWGKNTMNDTRGDGVKADPPGEQFRARFSWHGYFPDKAVPYDNIGGPIFSVNSTAAAFVDRGDTVGRLAAWQFVGNITLHADKSNTDKSDDPSQPATTSYEDSDATNFGAGKSAFNVSQMQELFTFIEAGHKAPRHADLIEPSGDFALQRAAPALSGTGGYSHNIAYGPYTLAPGDSIRIVMAEAAAGIGYEEGLRVGKLFKEGVLNDVAKNREVMKSKDTLMATFQRITDNFNSGWNIPQPPKPPKTFDVNSGGDRVALSWSLFDGESPEGFEIYRALGNIDSTYHKIADLPGSARSYDDVTLSRGFDYYYYITALGPNQAGGAGTPAGRLQSSRYYTQTYDPASLKRPAGTAINQIRIVPNPYISTSAPDKIRFPGGAAGDRIAFYDIPGNCDIKIFTEMGELIYEIQHRDGSGDAFWNQVTSSGQIVVSGIYIAVVTDNNTGEKQIAKFTIIR